MRKFLKTAIIGLLLATTIVLPPEPYTNAPNEQAAVSGVQNVELHYTLNRGSIPPLTYNDITLKIYIGEAASVSAVVDGKITPIQYDSGTGDALLTTSGSDIQVSVKEVSVSLQLGSVTKTMLKDDKKWAWSHGFDDNVLFKKYGIPAFDQYGWRATVYLIGSKLNDTREEGWLVDRPDMIRLVQKGWGIGNHTWSHKTVHMFSSTQAAIQDIQNLDNYIRQLAADAGRPDYRPIAFAAPAFDADYLPVILSLRDSGITNLQFNESGNSGYIRVEQDGIEPEYGISAIFDYNTSIGRLYDISYFGTGNERDQLMHKNIAMLHADLDDTHHYWLNTFTHDVDQSYPDKSIFAFIPWLYNTYGPGGDDSVWVAPAEEIYSYFIIRDRIKITQQGTSFTQPNKVWIPIISSR